MDRGKISYVFESQVMKIKVTFSRDGKNIFAKTKYKKGYVVWLLKPVSEDNTLYDHYSHEWVLYSKKEEYAPWRVVKWNQEFLFGHNLFSSVSRTAAAKHRYDIMNKLFTLEISPYILF